ncbi:MAG: hypothetical protein RDV48_28610 [Candidatus Eremiobacteraeota bacterium]|nr:hypothetical protein [Candidatus Eremiobacteraeota bacterium]
MAGKARSRGLYLFIDWLLALPEPLEMEFVEVMKKHEEGKLSW